MGADVDDLAAREYEKPEHLVYLSPYWIDRTEVTNGMYERCVRTGACQSPEKIRSKLRESYFSDPKYLEYPVIYVSWEDAAAYCQWADRRLPTEAEWEKAARGADRRDYPWGNNNPNGRLANFGGLIGDTSRVGDYPAGISPYGVLDMAGNVAEWVADWFDDQYYASSVYKNPSGPASGEFRILRGGSWFSQASSLRTTFRLWNYPDLRSETVGFRCAR
jgi:formylglycine-generating enzyme required for sulfatase activity